MIIFIYGPDTFRSRLKLCELKKKFTKEVDQLASSQTTINGETATIDKINQAAGSASLFARRRLVIIEKSSANKNKRFFDEMLNFIKSSGRNVKKDDDNIIIFWEEELSGEVVKNKLFTYLLGLPKSHLYQFKSLNSTETAAWIKREAESRQVKIKPAAITELVSMFGSNLWQINNEINKLISYQAGRKGKLVPGQGEIIEVDDVKALARGSFSENIFALTDAMGSRQSAQALTLLEQEIESGVAEAYLIYMIIRQFRLLILVKQAIEKGFSARKIMSQLKLHPYMVQKYLNQIPHYSLPVLKKIFQSLVTIDYKIKTGQADLKSALNLLMAKI